MKSKAKRWFGKINAVLLVVCMLMGGGMIEISQLASDGIGTLTASAAESNILAQGDCGADGDNVIYKLYSNGTLVISGKGNMKTFEWDYLPWNRTSVYKLKIESGVTNISTYAYIKNNRTSN